MSRFDEHLFGRLAVFNGYLTQDQLQECLAVQRSLQPAERKPIGQILLERGYIREDQLLEVLEIRRKKLRKLLLDSKDIFRTEQRFGRHALERGLVTPDQLEFALLEQQRLKRLNLNMCLGDIMVSLGYLHVTDVVGILSSQRTRILVCGKCDSHFTVSSYSSKREYRCKHCASVLEVPKYLDTVATDGVLTDDEETEIEVR